MPDKTTEGVAVDPAAVAALLQSQCGYHLAESDPLRRYLDLTHAQALYEALVDQIRSARGRALADLVAAGRTVPDIASVTGLQTRQRVQGLLNRAGKEGLTEERSRV
ncbi:hypothetical protein [Hamadaea tsunoensis]|uniref:hypothetical protein n=1 Tax=Hamadaea tsunoensis TaxID=53368 RepID=UPI0003F7E517|nr:hypothetical protein [Hamadaea tsunoensis]